MPIIYQKSLFKKTIIDIAEKEYYKDALNFHENTKYGFQKSNEDFNYISELRSDPQRVKNMTKHYKEYFGVPTFPLPALKEIIKESSKCSFEEVLINRRSSRDFNNTVILFRCYAKILLLSYGITGKMKYDIDDHLFLRAAPSAGALYPLEIYSAIFHVEGMEKGIYHYNVKKNYLEQIKKGNFTEECFLICNSQEFIKKASVIFFISGIIERTLNKYRNRGLRFIYMDAGHLVENMHLAATSENINACSLGGIYDYEAEKLLHIDGFYESLIYAFVIGN